MAHSHAYMHQAEVKSIYPPTLTLTVITTVATATVASTLTWTLNPAHPARSMSEIPSAFSGMLWPSWLGLGLGLDIDF